MKVTLLKSPDKCCKIFIFLEQKFFRYGIFRYYQNCFVSWELPSLRYAVVCLESCRCDVGVLSAISIFSSFNRSMGQAITKGAILATEFHSKLRFHKAFACYEVIFVAILTNKIWYNSWTLFTKVKWFGKKCTPME